MLLAHALVQAGILPSVSRSVTAPAVGNPPLWPYEDSCTGSPSLRSFEKSVSRLHKVSISDTDLPRNLHLAQGTSCAALCPSASLHSLSPHARHGPSDPTVPTSLDVASRMNDLEIELTRVTIELTLRITTLEQANIDLRSELRREARQRVIDRGRTASF